MELIPSEELKPSQGFNFAPMIDFLFLMLALFATLALSRSSLYDEQIQLVSAKGAKANTISKEKVHPVHVSLSAEGKLSWLTEFDRYPMENLVAFQKELMQQYQKGILPQEKSQTEVLLHIDKKAPWSAIADLIFSIRELGFMAHPVYEVE